MCPSVGVECLSNNSVSHHINRSIGPVNRVQSKALHTYLLVATAKTYLLTKHIEKAKWMRVKGEHSTKNRFNAQSELNFDFLT